MKTCFDYIVYTGGLAVNRYRGKGGASEEMIAELQANARQYTVWDTERDEWYVLDFDLAPVKVAQAPPVGP